MAVSKTARDIIAAGTSNSAGATTTGTILSLLGTRGGRITIKLTNGATGPTVAPNAYVYTSPDGSAKKLLAKLPGDTTANSVNEYNVAIARGDMYAAVDVKDNTVQAITCEAIYQELTTE